jgi:hypothetical protein
MAEKKNSSKVKRPYRKKPILPPVIGGWRTLPKPTLDQLDRRK